MTARRHGWSLLVGLSVLGGSASAQDGVIQAAGIGRGGCCPPAVVTPPGGWTTPAVPQPPTPGETTPPTPAPETTPNLQLGSELQGTAETASVALAGPNMFGDQFGTRGFRVFFAQPFGGTLVPRGPTDQFFGTASPISPTKTYGPGAVTFTNANGFGVQGLTFPAQAFTNSGTITFPVKSGSVALANQPTLEQALLAQAQKQFGPGVVLVNGGTFATLIPPGTVTTSGGRFETAPTTITQSPFLLTVLATAEGQLVIPSPSGGGTVGRTKISDDNSPLPHDRIIFDYDFYNNVPLTSRGVNVNRFSAGIEKTFLDGQMSLEIRMPFAATLSNDISTSGTTGSDEMEAGDLNLTFKALVYHSSTLAIAGGIGIAVPTAGDVTVQDAFGDELIRVRNEAVILTPYIAYLWTPTDRLFFQNWVEFPIDANGNPVNANLSLAGPTEIGRMRDQTLCQVDAQLGYWLLRPDESSSLVRGLAPFVELHYDTTLGNPAQLQAPGLTFVSDVAHEHELNLTAGFMTVVGDNLELGVGIAVPLLGNNDRSFDWQIGIHGNYFFGPSAGDRSRSGRVTSF